MSTLDSILQRVKDNKSTLLTVSAIQSTKVDDHNIEKARKLWSQKEYLRAIFDVKLQTLYRQKVDEQITKLEELNKKKILDMDSVKKENNLQNQECSIQKINERYAEQFSIIMGTLHQLDAEFMIASGFKIVSSTLTTRHGECRPILDKRGGLNPNTGLSPEAQEKMPLMSQLAQEIRYYKKNRADVYSSKALRAQETAAGIIGEGIAQNDTIKNNDNLPEISDNMSGIPYTNLETFSKSYRNTKFWDGPLQWLKYTISYLFYGNKETFKNIQSRYDKAYDVATEKGISFEKKFSDNSENCQTDPSLEHLIRDHITKSKGQTESERSDLWLIGHGKNFSTLFDSLFNSIYSFLDKLIKIKNFDFKYAETKTVYGIENEEGNIKLFTPPWSVQLDTHNEIAQLHFQKFKVNRPQSVFTEDAANNSEPNDSDNDASFNKSSKQMVRDLGVSPTSKPVTARDKTPLITSNNQPVPEQSDNVAGNNPESEFTSLQ